MSTELDDVRTREDSIKLPSDKGLFAAAAVEEPVVQDDYRALSSAAVVALGLGVLSGVAAFDWWLGIVPVLGIALGVYALRQIAAQPHEYTGRGLAKAGIVASALFLVTGFGWQGYVRATEVPDGHDRISYDELQPATEGSPDMPASALALDGQKVFIKGYVYPDGQTRGITRFMLVRDKGDCCFGGDPKISDRIQVTLADSAGMKFTTRLHKVAGTFRVQPGIAANLPGSVWYHIDNAELR